MQRMVKAVAMGAMLLMLGGCATGYVKNGFTGGYSDSKIDDSHYVVRFDGNGYASQERVWYFWIYRCAQLTREKGYFYFTLDKDPHRQSSYDMDSRQGMLHPAVMVASRAGRVADPGAAGGYRFTDTAGSIIYLPPIKTWHSSAEVSMYRDSFPERTLLLKAQSVLSLLEGYIRSNGKVQPPARMTVLEKSAFTVGRDHRLISMWSYLHKRDLYKQVPDFLRKPGLKPPPPPPAPPSLPIAPLQSGATQNI